MILLQSQLIILTSCKKSCQILCFSSIALFVIPHVWLSLSCIDACKYRLLIQLVKQYGVRKWSYIAQMLPGRIGKQCRERWHNHLRPDIKVLLISSSLILYYSIFTPTCFYGIH